MATTSLILCSIVLAVGLLGNILVIAVILTNKVQNLDVAYEFETFAQNRLMMLTIGRFLGQSV